jgi:hypothetical protein
MPLEAEDKVEEPKQLILPSKFKAAKDPKEPICR